MWRCGPPTCAPAIRWPVWRSNSGGRTPILVSDDNGLARASLNTRSISWVVASLGEDRALSPAYIRAWPQDDRTIWYTTDDRGMYRPGETLHLKGWVRNLDVSGDGDLEFLPSGELITYTAYGPLRNELRQRRGPCG